MCTTSIRLTSCYQIPFHYPWKTDPTQDGTVVGKLELNKEDTARLHAACKDHGRTITQVATAFSCLANAEYSLRIAGGEDEAFFEETLDKFKAATHFQAPFNAINSVS